MDPIRNKVFLSFLTAFGALGGFPTPPESFDRFLSSMPYLRWLTVFVLVYQGGSGQDAMLALEVTVAMFVLFEVTKRVEKYVDDEKGL